jgi:STAS-like domain of unknown function (DUF4325)
MPMIEMDMLRPTDELGPALAGRPNAAHLREQIEQAVAAGRHIVVDFDGALMSPSFIDELFAKMPASVRDSKLVDFKGLSDRTLTFVKFAVNGRS